MTEEYPMYIDRRDEKVVERMQVDKTYGARDVQEAYIRFTDICREKTAQDRKKALFNSPCMEFTGTPGYFVFVGFNQDGDSL